MIRWWIQIPKQRKIRKQKELEDNFIKNLFNFIDLIITGLRIELKDIYIPEYNKKYSIKTVSNKDLHVLLSNQERKTTLWLIQGYYSWIYTMRNWNLFLKS